MASSRMIRIGFIDSEKVAALPWRTECFFARLLLSADDYGLFDARPTVLRTRLFPLHLDQMSNQDIQDCLHQTEEAGLVRVYRVNGKEYVEIFNYGQRQRGKPKFPLPPDYGGNTPRNAADYCSSPQSTANCGSLPHSAAYTETETNTETKSEWETKEAAPNGSLDFPPPSRSSSMVPLPESVEEVEEYMRQCLIHPLDPEALRSSAERFYDHYVEQGNFIRNWKSRATIWAKDDAYREQDRKRLEKQKFGSDPFPDSADLGKQFS